MKRYVLRRPASAYGPAAYYPPGAVVCAQWASPNAAEQHRGALPDSPAWTAMTTREAHGLDKRDERIAREVETRRILKEDGEQHGARAIDETPGDMMSYPMLDGRLRGGGVTGDIVQVPIVAIRRITDGPVRGIVAKMPDGAIVLLPDDWALDDEPVAAWTEHLAKWRAGGFSYTRKGGAS